MNDDLRLIVLKSFEEVGNKVDKILMDKRNKQDSFIIPINEVRFNNGEGKVEILDSVRDKDIYILADVGNHNVTYKMFDYYNHMSPDDIFQDIKRVIYAIRDQSKRINIIMPLLYSSRQHRRKSRESLDCAVALEDLVRLNVKNIFTFDVHDKAMENAIPTNAFENVYPTSETIKTFLDKEKDLDLNNMFTIAPDTGAASRAELYADIFACDMGMFRKLRDLNSLVDGKYTITKHEYVGPSPKGKTVIVADDIIASGSSIIDTAQKIKELEAEKVYLLSTFGIFTKGLEPFKEAYDKNIFDKIYTTNLTYFNKEYLDCPFLECVDCSEKIASIINIVNTNGSLSPILNDKEKSRALVLENKR